MVTNVGMRYVNVVEPAQHKGKLTLEAVDKFTEGFSKPAVFRKLVEIDPQLGKREFYEKDSEDRTRWRLKTDDRRAAMRNDNGTVDWNYVNNREGTAKEFLDDIFVHQQDVYGHIGAISVDYSGDGSFYNDPYAKWGMSTFMRVKEKIFAKPWFAIDGWHVNGQMFFGHSTQEFGEPARGAVGSDWHMFPTLNMFVMIAGVKQWSTCPPRLGEQSSGYQKMLNTMGSGREDSGGEYDCDVVYLRPGDVLINPPYEWHKVLNGTGLTAGAAFRVVDVSYLSQLGGREALDTSRAKFDGSASRTFELMHFLTSINYASRHINRAQMMVNEIEYAYLRKNGAIDMVNIGHQ